MRHRGRAPHCGAACELQRRGCVTTVVTVAEHLDGGRGRLVGGHKDLLRGAVNSLDAYEARVRRGRAEGWLRGVPHGERDGRRARRELSATICRAKVERDYS